MTAPCIECEHYKAIYKDPRRPPVEEGLCLCKDCYNTAYLDEIDSVITNLQDLIANVPKELKEDLMYDLKHILD